MDARQRIRRDAGLRIRSIEERFVDRDLPQSVLQYYLLLRAIELAEIPTYINEYGARVVDVASASAGKLDLGYGDLSRFERDLCVVLREELEWWAAEHGDEDRPNSASIDFVTEYLGQERGKVSGMPQSPEWRLSARSQNN